MTDRIKGFTITLEEDVRVDDVQPILDAIKMVRGVASVKPSVSNVEDLMARSRVKHEWLKKLYKFINEELQ